MNTFEYLTALATIVVGLAFADMAASLHRLLRARRRVRWDWVTLCAAALVFLEIFQVWWRWYLRSGSMGDTVGQMLPFTVILMLLFLLASAVLPDEVPEGGLDLRAHFDENRSYFWSLYTAFLIAWVGRNIVLAVTTGDERLPAAVLSRWDDLLNIVLFAALIFIRPRWISGVAIVLAIVWSAPFYWSMALGGDPAQGASPALTASR